MITSLQRLEYIEYKNNYELLMAQHIKKSEDLRREINIETEPLSMLDKALLCISLMTGDKLFYDINIKKIGGTYEY